MCSVRGVKTASYVSLALLPVRHELSCRWESKLPLPLYNLKNRQRANEGRESVFCFISLLYYFIPGHACI